MKDLNLRKPDFNPVLWHSFALHSVQDSFGSFKTLSEAIKALTSFYVAEQSILLVVDL